MYKYRIHYYDNYKMKKSLTYETLKSYSSVLEMAERNFGKGNIIEIEPLNTEASVDKSWHILNNDHDDMG